LQVYHSVVITFPERSPQAADFMDCFAAERRFSPIPRWRHVNLVDDRLRWVWIYGIQDGLTAGAALSRQQSTPAGLDNPVNNPSGMSLPQRRYSRQRVQNVAHGAQSNHEQAELGLRVQTPIFSQQLLRRRER
jgi:hypothetical protein